MFELLVKNPLFWIGVIVAIIAGYQIYKKVTEVKYFDIVLPAPDTYTPRDDLLFGFYSSLENCYEQTKGFVNLIWYSHFYGVEKFIEILKVTTHKVVLDVAPLCLDASVQRAEVVKADAAESLRNYFKMLRDNGVLHKITHLYPKDEPNIFMASEAEHLKLINLIKSVAAEFPELSGVKYAVIYARGKPFWNSEAHDIVAIDNYGQKSQILTIGDHADLVKLLKPGQKTWLIPGAAFGQNPDPFVSYALAHPDEVDGVIPFLWFDDPNHKDVDYTGLVAAYQGFRAKWVSAAATCLNIKITSSNAPAGTLLSQYCNGFTSFGKYADGNGGSYDAVIKANDPICGYQA